MPSGGLFYTMNQMRWSGLGDIKCTLTDGHHTVRQFDAFVQRYSEIIQSTHAIIYRYSRLSKNAIVAFLENTALWKNRVMESIGSIGIKGLGVENSDSPSRM
jgi:hypothetical protein